MAAVSDTSEPLSDCPSVCLSSVFFGVYECLCMFGAVERFCVRLDF
jgi:hypothetical protein